MPGMRRHQAFKFELLPRGRQQRDMRRFAGACRYVFNQALALQKANYERGGSQLIEPKGAASGTYERP